jgi:DNA-binding transcriptional ArsR family regulator
MAKVTLDMNTFKALASDTRLDILRVLDGKRMSLKDISRATKLNKATLHEHLAKLHEAGLVKKKEREGHKWVYYKLTWKGEGLLHPENTRIVVMFSVTFVSLFVAFMFLVSFLQPITVGMAETIGDTTYLYEAEDEGIPLFTRSYKYNYLATLNATDQTVKDLTFELQNNSRHKLGIASSYDDITWVTPSQAPIDSKQYLLYEYHFENYYDNDSEGTKGDNDTNESVRTMWGGEPAGFSPIAHELIAIVQNPTFLYCAVVFITFFGVLLPLSTWRLWKNKKPKL